jgi:hypothetical protein
VLGVSVLSVMVISCRPTLNYRRGVSNPILAQRERLAGAGRLTRACTRLGLLLGKATVRVSQSSR